MLVGIVILVGLTIAVAALVLAPRLGVGAVKCSAAPDRPHPFGYKMAWLAVRSTDTSGVIEQLGLFKPQLANWESGLGTIYDDRLGEARVFVSPPVDGWTFVVGLSLPVPLGERFHDKASVLIERLSQRFPEVQYFFTYPLIDTFAWARARDGRIERAFAVGEGGVVWNRGKTTREELALGLKYFELRGVRNRKDDAGGEIMLHPTESHVLELAGRWGLDPTRIDAGIAEPALGLVGIVPLAWRPERKRLAA